MPESYVPAELHRRVTARVAGCCEYCRSQERFSPQAFSVEHIRPRSTGRETTSENLALSCHGCNNFKYTKTVAVDPVTRTEVPLFHPRQHVWNEPFAWSADATHMVGLTQMGRATSNAVLERRDR